MGGCYKIIFNHIKLRSFNLYFVNILKNCKSIDFLMNKINGNIPFKHFAIFSDMENAIKYKNELNKKYENRCKCRETGKFQKCEDNENS